MEAEVVSTFLDTGIKFWSIMLTLIGGFAWVISSYSKINHRIEQLEAFMNNKDIHWSVERKIAYFTPREVFDDKTDTIAEALRRIEKKIDNK